MHIRLSLDLPKHVSSLFGCVSDAVSSVFALWHQDCEHQRFNSSGSKIENIHDLHIKCNIYRILSAGNGSNMEKPSVLHNRNV